HASFLRNCLRRQPPFSTLFPYTTLFRSVGWIVFIGLPIMIGEIAVGRRTRSNPYGAYKLLGGKSWALVGLFGILCGIMILSFYKDRKSTRLNSSHVKISYAVFCLQKKNI